MDIEVNKLPIPAANYMKANYPNDIISEIWKTIDNNDLVHYGVVISRTNTFYDYIFDANGDFLRIVEEDQFN